MCSEALGDRCLPSLDELFELKLRDAKERLVDQFERSYVLHLLERARGNVAAAARLAGVDRVTLFRTMKRHGIRPTRAPR
jgi:transcriptional regulator of acetoin/glycerol metabolism